MKISLIFPSRGRPEKAHQTLKNWSALSGLAFTGNLECVMSLDNSDTKLIEYHKFARDIATLNDNTCVVEATNHAAKKSTGDILIYLSDDFACFENWGQLVINEFAKYRGPTLIKVDDCLQPNFTRVLTIPMMNRELYNKLGYFWHPEYKSMFCDEDLYWTTEKLGALKMATHLKFPHEHVSIGKAENDETYKRSAANWDQGKAVFAKRKAAGFPV